MDIKLRIMVDKLADAISIAITIPYYGQKLDTSLRNKNIEVGYFFNGKYDAFLKWDYHNDRPLIAVDSFQAIESPYRANFSMAHELGHLIINYGWSPFRDNDNLSSKKVLSVEYRGRTYNGNERIMDEFAAGFLMPSYIMSKILTKFKSSNIEEIIKYMSNHFHVSKEAAELRLKIIYKEQQDEA